MTDEEKIKEIIKETFSGHGDLQHLAVYTAKDVCYDLLSFFAKWKDKQFEEEKKELRGLVDMLPINETNQTIIEDLKAMLQ